MSAADGYPALSRRVTLLLLASLTVMSSATIAPSMPHMAEVFSGTPNAEFLTKLILTTPALAIVLFAPLAGAIVDRFGRLRFLHANLVLYGFAGASGFVLDDLHQILVGRALLGIAVGGTMTTVSALTGDYFSGEARTRYAGVQSLFMSLGTVVFIGLGGLLADIDWRSPFLLYLSAWLMLIPVALHLEEPKRAARHGPAVGAPEQPLPVATIALAYCIVLLSMIAYYMTPVQIPFYLRQLGVESSALAGLAIILSSLAAAAASFGYSRLRRRNGFLSIYAISFALLAAGYAIIAAAAGYGVLLLGAIISGVGVGFIFPNAHLWVIALAPPRYRGRLAGGMTASLFLGQFLSPIVVQPAVPAFGLAGSFALMAGALVVLAALIFVLRHHVPRAEERAARGGSR